MSRPDIDSILHEADALIIEHANTHGPVAGLAVGVVHKGELIYAFNSGLADIDRDIPVTSDTSFRIGSISKTFTAIGLMQLWEQGKFQLDDPVNAYLKAYQVRHPDPSAPPITFRHMMTHRTGIGMIREFGDLFRVQGSDYGLDVREGVPVPTLREYYNGLLQAEIYPGVKWAYDNHGFATLGQLIEDISGQPFGDYMVEHVFDPLGMAQSDFFLTDRVRGQLAKGYQSVDGLLKPVEYLNIAVPGAGSVFSSVHEMAKYLTALMNGGKNGAGAVLKPETLDMMMSPQFQLDERLMAMGLAFWLEFPEDNRDQRHRVAWHGGGWPGFTSVMMVAPDDDTGIVVFNNAYARVTYPIAIDLMRRLLDLPDPSTQLPRPGVENTPYLWSELTGSYAPPEGFTTNMYTWRYHGGELEVKVRGGQLVLQSFSGALQDGVILFPVDSDDPLAFQIQASAGLWVWPPSMIGPTHVLFKRDHDGEINRLQIGFLNFNKRPPLPSVVDNWAKIARRRRADFLVWFLNGMPGKIKVTLGILTRFAALMVVFGLFKRRKRAG